MVPFFKTLFANTFQGFTAIKEAYLYVHRKRHVLAHIPTCHISSVCIFLLLLLLSFPNSVFIFKDEAAYYGHYCV